VCAGCRMLTGLTPGILVMFIYLLLLHLVWLCRQMGLC
jgi:hypothetical protein